MNSLGMDASSALGKARGGSRSFAETLSALGTSSTTHWLGEAVLNNIKKGAHVLVEGRLLSSTYEQENGKGKKAKIAKITSWSIRADVVRKLDRVEPEPQAFTSAASRQTSDSSEEIQA